MAQYLGHHPCLCYLVLAHFSVSSPAHHSWGYTLASFGFLNVLASRTPLSPLMRCLLLGDFPSISSPRGWLFLTLLISVVIWSLQSPSLNPHLSDKVRSPFNTLSKHVQFPSSVTSNFTEMIIWMVVYGRLYEARVLILFSQHQCLLQRRFLINIW